MKRNFLISYFILFSSFSSLVGEEAPLLINVKKLAPGIIVELRYATTDNFTGKKLYPAAECLLCEPVAKRLARVQANLEKEGLGLKVWDCYRPISVQKILWEVAPDRRFVANPKTGSRHNRGASVDLTLVDKNGNELPMPTGFDEFSPKAYRKNKDLPPDILRNRNKLEQAMESEGFLGLPTEWWHFDDPSWKNFALRDEPLGDPALYNDITAVNKDLPFAPEVKQLIVVRTPDWKSQKGTLALYLREEGAWKIQGSVWPVVIGLKGMAWGTGLHTPETSGPVKREGDLTTPAGVFWVGEAYGYALKPPEQTKWPYQYVDDSWICVDDPTSTSYNKIFSCPAGFKQDWDTAEKMRREDHLYKWVINIRQNHPLTIKGGGSCIFFHLWRHQDSGTEGCVAMEEAHLVRLLRWLDPELKPATALLPEHVYQKLKSNWGLP